MTTATEGNGTYTGLVAKLHDRMYPDPLGDIAQLTACIQRAAPGRRVMEFGIGSGRAALPLAEAGLEVSGVEISTDMLKLLDERDTEKRIRAHRASFIDDELEGEYDAVTILLNTLLVATTAEQQLAVLRNAHRCLVPGGVLFVECFAPSRYHGLTAPAMSLRDLGGGDVVIEQYTVEPSLQLLVSQNLVFLGEQRSTYTQVLRYVFPAELDSAARLAGLEPLGRMADWQGAAVTSASERFISAYRRSAE